MGIKIDDIQDTLKLKVSSQEGTVNVYSKPNVFSLKVSPSSGLPLATQDNFGAIKGSTSILINKGVAVVNPEYFKEFLNLNVGDYLDDITDSLIPHINQQIHEYFEQLDDMYLSKTKPDTAQEVITFLKGIVASGISTFIDLIANGNIAVRGQSLLSNTTVSKQLEVQGLTRLVDAIASGKITAENIDVNDTLLTDILRVTTQAEIQDILLKGQMNSETFNSGFLGSGFRLNKINDRWTLELDDIIVRKTMTIYELIVQKVRYQGGQVIHSPAGGKITSVIEEEDGWICEHDSTDSFTTGAQVLCQTFRVGSEKQNPDGSTTFNGARVKRYWRLVTSYGKGWFKLSKTEMEPGSDIPEVNDEVAILGHRTDPNQQAAILLVSSGPNSPYIAHYANIDSFILDDEKEVLREGNLSGIVDSDFGQLSGYGLYSNNVYLKGNLRIRSGKTVEQTIEDKAQDLQNEIDEIREIKQLRIEKVTTPGYEFYREGQEYNHTLGIRIYEGENDVTEEINIARFVWMRISENPDGDSIWNDLHAYSGANIDITQADLVGDTSFIVQFWDASKNKILNTIKF